MPPEPGLLPEADCSCGSEMLVVRGGFLRCDHCDRPGCTGQQRTCGPCFELGRAKGRADA